MLSWLRELCATILTFERSALEPGYALRCTVGVAIPLVVATAAGKPALGVPAAIGAFITGFTSLQGVYRTRVGAILAAAVGMALTSFIGALAAHSTPALLAATALAGYAVGTVGQLGPIAATVALNSFVAFIIFSSQPLSPPAAAQDSALVLAGGFIQALLVLIAWPIARRGVERAALADVYHNLATFARELADGNAAFPPTTPLATARQIFADPQPFASSGEMARLSRLLEDAAIIRRRLGAVAASAGETASRDALSRLCLMAADRLDRIAGVLGSEKRDVGTIEMPPSHVQNVAGAGDLESYLRDAAEAAAMIATGRVPAITLLSKPRPGPYVQNRIDWLSRDSWRFSLVLTVAMFFGRHFQADRGYWIPLTAAIVLKPDFHTTFVRGFGRIAGTLAGAAIASVIAAPLRGHAAAQNIGVVVAAAAAYLTFNPNYALFTVAITSFVVIVLGMRGLPGTTTIEARLFDTLFGGALAMFGYLILPSWEGKRTRALLADLLDTQNALAGAILRQYGAPTKPGSRAVEHARDRAWRARAMAEASIDRTRHEPHLPHTIGAARALRILAASQRFALANLALETASETGSGIAIPELPEFADALQRRMTELALALRQSRRARRDQRLDDLITQLQGEIAQSEDAPRRFVLERLLAYAQAAAQIARLVGRTKAG